MRLFRTTFEEKQRFDGSPTGGHDVIAAQKLQCKFHHLP
jgi:hypothetical protein